MIERRKEIRQEGPRDRDGRMGRKDKAGRTRK